MTAPDSGRIPYRDPRYAKHAAPQSIRAYLQLAMARQRQADRVVAWLAALLVEREEQVERGQWPPPPAAEDASGGSP